MFTSYEKSKCGLRIVKSPCSLSRRIQPQTVITNLGSPTLLGLSPCSSSSSIFQCQKCNESPSSEYPQFEFNSNHNRTESGNELMNDYMNSGAKREETSVIGELINNNPGSTTKPTGFSPVALPSPSFPSLRHRSNIVEAHRYSSPDNHLYSERPRTLLNSNTSSLGTKLPSLATSPTSASIQAKRRSISALAYRVDYLVSSAVETGDASPLLRYRQLTPLYTYHDIPSPQSPQDPPLLYPITSHSRSFSQPSPEDTERPIPQDRTTQKRHSSTDIESHRSSNATSPHSKLFTGQSFRSPPIHQRFIPEKPEHIVGIRRLSSSRLDSPPSFETLSKLNSLFSPRADCDFEEVNLE